MKQKHLTPEEEDVFVRKGSEMPFSGDIMIFLCQGLIAAKDAVQNYIAQKTSLLLDAVGLVLMMR